LVRKIILSIFAIISFSLFVSVVNVNHATAASPRITINYLIEKNIHMDTNIANTTGFMKDEILCLALNIYHEARGSSVKNKLAVGFVTFNRMRLPNFPRTICGVVFQHTTRVVRKENINGSSYDATVKTAQFSWITKSQSEIFPREIEEWTEIQRLAFFLYKNQGRFEDFTNGATHFYSKKLLTKMKLSPPIWDKKGVGKFHIGEHVYMRLTSF